MKQFNFQVYLSHDPACSMAYQLHTHVHIHGKTLTHHALVLYSHFIFRCIMRLRRNACFAR
jgi:hypothetical protein